MARNEKYKKTLEEAFCQSLKNKYLSGKGTSRAQAKELGNTKNIIFSKDTYKTYIKQSGYFCEWLKVNHPEVTNLKKAKKY